MTILKSTSRTASTPAKQDGRRSFIWKAGAALSAGLAAAVPGMAKTGNNEKNLKLQLARLEDENAIRRLHDTYEYYLDSGRYREIADLFTDDAEVIFNGGIYRGKDRGIRRLYSDRFRACMTGKKMELSPGFRLDDEQHQDVIELSGNGSTAQARFHYTMQAGEPMEEDSVLVKMARLQGEGIRKWREGGIYEITYVKDAKQGSWKMARLEHRVLAREEGSSRARPVSVAPFDKVYPGDPAGPDRLIT